MTRRILILFGFLFVAFCNSLSAQGPAIQWQKSLGGSAKDTATSIKQTSDGGFIVAGQTRSNDSDVSDNHGGVDVWVVKLTSAGAVSWKKTYGGSGNDEANAIEQTKDGGYIFVGRTNSADGDVSLNKGMTDAWIVKLDSAGNIVWEKTYGGSDQDEAMAVNQTQDGAYIIAAWAASADGDPVNIHNSADYWILKLTDSGTIIWNKCYGGYAGEFPYAIQQTMDSGYVVAGWTMSYYGDVSGNKGGADYWVLKLDDTGKISWNKTLGGIDDDFAYAIVQSADGGYLVGGYTMSSDGDVVGFHGGGTDVWLVKLDSAGNIDWSKCYGGSDGESTRSVEKTNGGYIFVGGTTSTDGDVSGKHSNIHGFPQADFWVVEIDDTGAISWAKCYGGSEDESAYSVQPTSDGGYIVAGYSDSDDGDVSNNHGLLDYWVVKLDASTGIPPSPLKGELRVFPNPVSEGLTLSLSEGEGMARVYNTIGQLIYSSSSVHKGLNTIDTKHFAAGVYVLELMYSAGSKEVVRVVKE